MDDEVEKLILLSNKNKKYQILVIILSALVWIASNSYGSMVGFFEQLPQVEYKVIDSETGKLVSKNATLDDKICKGKYDIISNEDYSMAVYFKVECNNLLISLMSTLNNVGNIAGMIFLPFAIDFIGFKLTLLISGLLYLVTLIVYIFITNIYVALFLIASGSFLSMVFATGIYMLLSEIVIGSVKSVGLAISNLSFNLATIFYTVIINYSNSWRAVYIVSACLCLFCCVIILFLIEDSPRTYLNHYELLKFIQSLHRIAKFNKCEKDYENLVLCNFDNSIIVTDSTPELKAEYLTICQDLILYYEDHEKFAQKTHYNIFHVLKYPSQRKPFFLMNYIYLFIVGAYIGMIINIKNWSGSIVTNALIVNSGESIVVFFVGYIVNIKMIGRKGYHILLSIIAMVGFLILVIFRLEGNYQNVLLMITRWCLAGVYADLYIYSTEIYSIKVMEAAMSGNIILGQIGGVIMGFLVQYVVLQKLLIILICFNVLNIVCGYFLKETLNKPLQIAILEEEEIVTKLKEDSKILSYKGF